MKQIYLCIFCLFIIILIINNKKQKSQKKQKNINSVKGGKDGDGKVATLTDEQIAMCDEYVGGFTMGDCCCLCCCFFIIVFAIYVPYTGNYSGFGQCFMCFTKL